MSKKQSTVEIFIDLNENKVPEKIQWKASEMPGGEKIVESKAMLLGFFDKETLETLRFDIWTSEMQVVEMDRFIFQSLRAMADIYYKSTQNAELANDMQKFAQHFGQKTEILKPE